MYDGADYARHLFDIRTMALLRVVMIWFLVVGIVLIRSARANANTPVVAQQLRRPA